MRQRPDGAISTSKHLGQQLQYLHRPAMHGRVIDGHAALGHHLFEVAQTQGIGGVPAHAHQHDLQREVQPLDHLPKSGRFELDMHRYHGLHRSGIGLLRQNLRDKRAR